MLDAHIVVDRPGFGLDLPIRVAAGEVVALLGPNGAGKSTALRALAGLLELSRGHVRLAGRDLHGIEPPRRRVGVVFQDYLLFPHLSALDNVAFGPRSRGTSRRAAQDLARDWLARLGLADQAGSRPRALSGGQAQRVALARALATSPDLLLLDEPLSALDARTRPETRAALRTHLTLHAGATLLVTHDPQDAVSLASRLIIIEDGKVVQQGTPQHLATNPRTDYVARLLSPG